MRHALLGTLAVMVGGLACGAGSETGSSQLPAYTGGLNLTLQGPAFADVASVRINLITIIHDCGDRGIAEQVIPLAGGPSPPSAFFVVPPDRYTVCLTALDGMGQPVDHCSGGVGNVFVRDQQTTEVSAVLSCSQPRGGLGVSIGFNSAPVIEGVTVEPGRFFDTCHAATMAVTASDRDGDPLEYLWFVAIQPTAATPVLNFDGPRASLVTFVPGDYEIAVVVLDGRSGSTIRIPLHVAPCP